MRDPVRNQRPAQVVGNISLGSCGGNGVAVYLPAGASQSLSSAIATLGFDLA